MLDNIQTLRHKTKMPVLILDEPNMRYYTGITQSGALLIDKEETLLTRDMELARNCAISNIIKVKARTSQDLLELLKKKKIKKVGVALESLSYPWFKKLQTKVKLVDVSKTLSDIRAIKSKEEIASISRACELADRAMTEIAGNIRPGMTERQLRNFAYSVLPIAEDVAFSFIIASGPNSEYTHVVPSESRIALNDLIIFDIGFKVDGYCSDLTRTFCLSPTTQQKELYDTIIKAQKLAIDNASLGASCGKIWNRVGAFFRKDDLARYWKYGLGHGVGLDIHEAPSLAEGSKDVLKNGMTFTIEPGLHIPDFGGARIEDTFAMDHGLRALTSSDNSLEP